jgi:hypothetical protein
MILNVWLSTVLMDIMIKLIDELMTIYKDGYLMLVGMFKHYIQFWVW